MTIAIMGLALVAKAFGMSAEDVRAKVGDAIRVAFPTAETCGGGPYVEAVFDDRVVFSGGGYGSRLLQVGYKFDPAAMAVTLVGQPIEVIRDYKPVGPAAAAAGLLGAMGKAAEVRKVLKCIGAPTGTGKADNADRTEQLAADGMKDFGTRITEAVSKAKGTVAKLAAARQARTAAATPPPKTEDDKGPGAPPAPAQKDGALSSGDLAAGGGELAPDQSSIASEPGKRRKFQGIDLVIDRPAGYTQKGTDAEGKPFERTYKVDYGYIPGTSGGDGEGLDVFVGPNEEAPGAYFAEQQKDDGTFDEYKLLFGFEDVDKAASCYLDHIPKQYLKSVHGTTVGVVKALLGLEPGPVMKAAIADLLEQLFVSKALALPVNALDPVTKPLEDETQPPTNIGGGEDVTKSVEVRRFIALGGSVEVKKADEIAPDAPNPDDEIGPRFLLGVVLEPDTVDSQGDVYSAEEIEKTAHDWMARFRNLDLQHKVFINGLATPVESYIVRSDPTEDGGDTVQIGGQPVKIGAWVLGVELADPTIRARAKDGKITGFSINGLARRERVAA